MNTSRIQFWKSVLKELQSISPNKGIESASHEAKLLNSNFHNYPGLKDVLEGRFDNLLADLAPNFIVRELTKKMEADYESEIRFLPEEGYEHGEMLKFKNDYSEFMFHNRMDNRLNPIECFSEERLDIKQAIRKKLFDNTAILLSNVGLDENVKIVLEKAMAILTDYGLTIHLKQSADYQDFCKRLERVYHTMDNSPGQYYLDYSIFKSVYGDLLRHSHLG